MKKNILSKILALGVVVAPILVGTALIGNSSLTSNENNLMVKGETKNKPIVPNNGSINYLFVQQLINYKKDTSPNWDGSLVEEDFSGGKNIENNAFADKSEIRSIILPKTVITIGANAFSGATNLTTISALGATTIGANAFARTTSMSNMGIKLTESENIQFSNALNWGTKTSKLDIKKLPRPTLPTSGIINEEFVKELVTYKKYVAVDTSVPWDYSLVAEDFSGGKSVDVAAFQSNTEIKSITLPSTVLKIDASAFSDARALTTISALGATSIGANAFARTNGITGIGNSKINLTYSKDIKIGNVLFWGTTSEKVSIANGPVEPTVPLIITDTFVNSLIEYKKYNSSTATPWNGSLLESDFINATGVADAAFQNNTEITSITLPSTVTSIGHNAFAGASNLNTISALGVTSIGDGAFSGMSGITGTGDSKINLTFSENIKYSNSDLWGIDVAKLNITGSPEMPLIPEDGIITSNFVNLLIEFKNSLLPTGSPWDGVLVDSDFAGANSVAAGAFQNKTQVTSITLPPTVSTIGANAFSGMSGITGTGDSKINLTFSENIKPGNAQFWGIEINKLNIINTPSNPEVPLTITPDFVNELITYKKSMIASDASWNGVLVESDFITATSVAEDAFKDEIGIKSIILPRSITKIGSNAFSGASNLTTISALGATSIGTNAFAGANAIIPSGIKLTESENIKATQGNASNWGTELNKLEIIALNPPVVPVDINYEFIDLLINYKNINGTVANPWDGALVESDFDGANSVAAGAFQNRNEITSITLPPTVSTIGANAFSGASNLTTISALGATSIGADAFAGTSGITGLEDSKINLTFSENIKPSEANIWGTTLDKLSIANTPIKPTVPEGIITPAFVTELITYKKEITTVANPWDGSLVEEDFVGAKNVHYNAFQNNTEITSITLPNTVLTIGADAFNGASNLTTISALGATSIGANAFAGTTSIIPNGIKLTKSENINVDKAILWGTTGDSLDIKEPLPPNPDPDKPGGFFDDTNNIYIVAGAGAGLLLLIAGIVTGVLVHRKKGSESDSSKDKNSKDKKEKESKKDEDSKDKKDKKEKESKKDKDSKDKKEKKEKKSKKDKDSKDKKEKSIDNDESDDINEDVLSIDNDELNDIEDETVQVTKEVVEDQDSESIRDEDE